MGFSVFLHAEEIFYLCVIIHNIMTNHTKDSIQYGCAVFTLVAGVTLCYINFLMTGDLTSGVLGFTGMCMSFTGGVFGITLYVRSKTAEEVRNYMEEHLKQEEEE